MIKIQVRVGDLVRVTTGSKEKKGRVGKILEIDRKTLRLKIENLFYIKKHIKPQKDRRYFSGGIVQREGTIHVSNVTKVKSREFVPHKRKPKEI